jgi:hypothetical protein
VEETAEEVAPLDLQRMNGRCGKGIGSTAGIRRSQVERSGDNGAQIQLGQGGTIGEAKQLALVLQTVKGVKTVFIQAAAR